MDVLETLRWGNPHKPCSLNYGDQRRATGRKIITNGAIFVPNKSLLGVCNVILKQLRVFTGNGSKTIHGRLVS